MSTLKHFHIGDILSVTTGLLLSPRYIAGFFDVLNFLHDTSLYAHQLPRAVMDAKSLILEQHPQLSNVDTSGVTTDNWEQFLRDQVAIFGEQLELMPIPHSDEL